MNRVKIIFILGTLLTFVALTYYYTSALETTSSIESGELDLSHTTFDTEGIIELNGEWEFYWHQLLEPDDFIHNQQANMKYAYVPGNWMRDQEGNSYSGKGYATYRVTITNIPSNKYFGLKKANIRSASKIYVNGELILTDGTVSTQLEGSVQGNNSEVIYFELEDSTAEIIVQAANHEYIVGGIAKPITFGEQKPLSQQHTLTMIFEFAMILIVMIIGFLYLSLYLISKDYRKKEPVTLPLALSCLFFGIMNSIYSERILNNIFPELTLDLTFRFGHFMSALSVIMVWIVVNNVNSMFLSNKLRNTFIGLYSLFLLFVLTLPLNVYTVVMNTYMILVVFIFFFIWLRIVWLFIKNKRSVFNDLEYTALTVSVFSIFLFWFDMIVYSFGLKTDMVISFLAIAVYSVALAALLTFRYTVSYKKNEELSIKLIETFSTLDQTTKEVQRNELAFLQAQIKPHFLFNALSSIISLCYTDGDRAGRLLTDLSNYLKRSFDLDTKKAFVTIDNELKLIEVFVKIEKARFGDRIQVDYDIDDSVRTYLITPLVIEPLVENALRHGVLKSKQGGQIKLTIKKQQASVYISVENNGKGMDSEQLKRIQEGARDFSSAEGNGISLVNISNRLKSVYQVNLNFESNTTGTKVYFTIPIQESTGEDNDD